MTGSLARAHERLVAGMDIPKRRPYDRNPDVVFVMPVIVHLPRHDAPRHCDVVVAAAQAAAAVCLDERAGADFTPGDGSYADSLDRWYHYGIRKVVRRARNSPWEKVHSVAGVTCSHNGADVRACVPSDVTQTPVEVTRLQIAGTTVPGSCPSEVLDTTVPVLYVNADLGMTTGKTAAQVGHAAMLVAAEMQFDQVREWAAAGFPLHVAEVEGTVFDSLMDTPDAVVVRDAGFTEIAPNTATVVALMPDA